MKVRRTMSLLCFGTYTIIILQSLQGIVLAGPIVKRSSRMIREVYPEIEPDKHEGSQAEVCIVGDVVYGADEPVPSDQPCLKCKCQPPGVQCEAIQCTQKQGCKTIHKTNQCCPEYQCECMHNGKIYGNGERLATLPGGECSVCYCRGGEVQCANVSCYNRADCEGRTVPGQCCPKYDHCPLKEPLLDRLLPHTTTSTIPSINTERDVFTAAIYDVRELINQDNKITDTQTSTTQSSASTPSVIDSVDSSNNLHVHTVDPLEIDLTSADIKSAPGITIQEIISDIKEIPITTASKQNVNVLAPKAHAPLIDKQALHNPKDTASDLAVGDADSEPSEILEIYHQPPPVLKIGDQLLIFKKGELVSEKDLSTPVPVITIIGAEGLQRGTEDSSEFHDLFSQLQGPQKDVGNFDDFFENETLPSSSNSPLKESHIISFVKQKKQKTTSSSSTPETHTDLSPSFLEFQEFDQGTVDLNTTFIHDDINQTNVEPSKGVQLVANITNLDEQEPEVLINLYRETHPVENTVVTQINSVQTKLPDTVNQLKGIVDNKYLRQENISELFTDNEELENPSFAPGVVSAEETYLGRSNDSFSNTNNFQLEVGNDTEGFFETDSSTETAVESTSHFPNSASRNKTPYYRAHILINMNATLPTVLIKQAAASDIEDRTDVTNTNLSETKTHAPGNTVITFNYDTTMKPNENLQVALQEDMEDSGEATTTRNNETSEVMSTENASIEATQNDSDLLKTTDLVEILPGFKITTEKSKNTEQKHAPLDDPKMIKQNLSTTIKPVPESGKGVYNSSNDDDIFKQLNEELNSTLGSFNLTAFKDEAEAEAIFKELLEEVTSSTLPPRTTNEDGTVPQLHEKESQLLQKVSEAISKYQSKESKEALDARIMGILKEFFRTQHKLDGNKPSEAIPVLPTIVA